MAFFGSADSDSLVKQLRSQLAQKDFEIQTLINEQTKKDELWSETKRAKDDALYKASSRSRTISSVVILIVSFCCTFSQAQTEQERAMKAERTLAKSTAVCLTVPPSRYLVTTLTDASQDLQNANMRLANLESTLNDANVRHKKDQKDIDRLQYGKFGTCDVCLSPDLTGHDVQNSTLEQIRLRPPIAYRTRSTACKTRSRA